MLTRRVEGFAGTGTEGIVKNDEFTREGAQGDQF